MASPSLFHYNQRILVSYFLSLYIIYITRLGRYFQYPSHEGRLLAEIQSRTGIVDLHASIMDRDNIEAERDRSLAKAVVQAQMAEKSKKNPEDKIKSSRPDHDSALQKKQNTVEHLKDACEQATKVKRYCRSRTSRCASPSWQRREDGY